MAQSGGGGGDHRIYPSTGEPIAAFLQRARPIQITTHSWVQVFAPGPSRDRDEEAALSLGQQVLSAATPGDRNTVQHLLEVARRTGYATGKWLIFADTATVDQVWRKIAEARRAPKSPQQAASSP